MDDETATVTGCAQVFDLHALKAFAPDTRVRTMLFKSDQLWSEIACYEPGQSTVMHQHPEGRRGDLRPRGHREHEHRRPGGRRLRGVVRNLGTERCVIMFLKVNPKVLKA